MNENLLSIKDVCKLLDLTEVYVRRMILKGKIETTKLEIHKNTYKHMITREEVNRWRSSVSGRSRREDGRNKFTLYGTSEEIEQIRKLLEEGKIESVIERSNKVKEVNNGTSN